MQPQPSLPPLKLCSWLIAALFMQAWECGQRQLLPCCFANWSLILSVVLCCLTGFFLFFFPEINPVFLSSPLTGADMDVCLTSYGHCNYVSGKHACIFYDEVSAWVLFYYFIFFIWHAWQWELEMQAAGCLCVVLLCGLQSKSQSCEWFHSSEGCVSIFCQTPFLKHRALPAGFLWANCSWTKTDHK